MKRGRRGRGARGGLGSVDDDVAFNQHASTSDAYNSRN